MPRGKGCAAHVHTYLVPQERHHVWPSQYHGPDTKDNLVTVCANAHSDIHYLLEAWLRRKPVDLRQYGLGVRYIAARGYEQVMAYAESLAEGKTP